MPTRTVHFDVQDASSIEPNCFFLWCCLLLIKPQKVFLTKEIALLHEYAWNPEPGPFK